MSLYPIALPAPLQQMLRASVRVADHAEPPSDALGMFSNAAADTQSAVCGIPSSTFLLYMTWRLR